MLSAGFSRNRQPVWSLQGGGLGGTNGLTVRRKGGVSEDYAFVSGLVIEAGDEIVIRTANGGGYHPQNAS